MVRLHTLLITLSDVERYQVRGWRVCTMAQDIPAILHILRTATRSWSVQVSVPAGPLEDPVQEALPDPLCQGSLLTAPWHHQLSRKTSVGATARAADGGCRVSGKRMALEQIRPHPGEVIVCVGVGPSPLASVLLRRKVRPERRG